MAHILAILVESAVLALLFLAIAVGTGGILALLYNRILTRIHESVFKKLLSLGLLPLGVLAGVAGAARLEAGQIGAPERIAWLFLTGLGFLLVPRFALIGQQKRELLAPSRLELLQPRGDYLNWRRFSLLRRAALRLLRPINEVCDLRLHQRTLEVPHLPAAFDGYRIVHLTDFHIHPTLKPSWYERIVDETLELRPDLILFGGDFISRNRYIRRVIPTMKRLAAPDGVFYVRGNHDFWRSPQRIARLARRAGMHLLSNQAHLLQRGGEQIALLGLETPYIALSDQDRDSFLRLPYPRIGLVHDPVAFEQAYDLGCFVALAGHTHGGQVRLPFFGTTLSGTSAPALFASDVGRIDSMLTFTSNGQGAFFPLRVGAPPEIILLELRGTPHR